MSERRREISLLICDQDANDSYYSRECHLLEWKFRTAVRDLILEKILKGDPVCFTAQLAVI